jgi:hypothetical protein
MLSSTLQHQWSLTGLGLPSQIRLSIPVVRVEVTVSTERCGTTLESVFLTLTYFDNPRNCMLSISWARDTTMSGFAPLCIQSVYFCSSPGHTISVMVHQSKQAHLQKCLLTCRLSRLQTLQYLVRQYLNHFAVATWYERLFHGLFTSAVSVNRPKRVR